MATDSDWITLKGFDDGSNRITANVYTTDFIDSELLNVINLDITMGSDELSMGTELASSVRKARCLRVTDSSGCKRYYYADSESGDGQTIVFLNAGAKKKLTADIGIGKLTISNE